MWFYDSSIYVSCLCKTTFFLAKYALHSLWAGRKMEPYGSKWISFPKCSELLRMKTALKPWILASANQRPSRHPSLDHSDVAHEHDVMLPIKGEHVHMLEAVRSNFWLYALGLYCGDQYSVVDGKAGLFLRDIVSASNSKNAFTPFYFA